METKQMNKPSASRFWSWFNPVGRQAGGIGFILNRLAGLGLTLYLFMHLIVLSKLAQGPAAYDSFIAMAKSPLFIFGELFVVAAVFIHGLNGIRIVLTSLGIGVEKQKSMFYALMAIAAVLIVYFAVKMISHA
jgi:succinate dehydrogenase / fumarate reductase cytochrome b subunit